MNQSIGRFTAEGEVICMGYNGTRYFINVLCQDGTESLRMTFYGGKKLPPELGIHSIVTVHGEMHRYGSVIRLVANQITIDQ